MQDADHILIPLLDGGYTLAQIALTDGNTVLLYLTSRHMTRKSEVFEIGPKDVKSVIAADISSLGAADWEVVGYETIPKLGHTRPDLADTTPHDPAVIEAFANALHGLYPWDGFPDPDFFTSLLRTPENLPSRIKMTADLPKPDAS